MARRNIVRAVTFQPHEGPADALLRQIDAVTVPVPDLVQGLWFYRDGLGQELLWRNDELGQAALRMPDTDTEIVPTTQQRLEPNWLVASVPEAVRTIVEAGGRVVTGHRTSRSAGSLWSRIPSATLSC